LYVTPGGGDEGGAVEFQLPGGERGGPFLFDPVARIGARAQLVDHVLDLRLPGGAHAHDADDGEGLDVDGIQPRIEPAPRRLGGGVGLGRDVGQAAVRALIERLGVVGPGGGGLERPEPRGGDLRLDGARLVEAVLEEFDGGIEVHGEGERQAGSGGVCAAGSGQKPFQVNWFHLAPEFHLNGIGMTVIP
jgi:hypothetical protein